jgi:hypothetical protein
VRRIATDPSGNIYLFGSVTDSPVPGNGKDLFIARLNPAATAFAYLVYFRRIRGRIRRRTGRGRRRGCIYHRDYQVTHSQRFPSLLPA